MARQPVPSGEFAPLRDRTFRTIWLAGLASNFGTFMQAVGAAWLMTDLSASSFIVALVQAAAFGPILLAPLAGAIADMVDRRRLILAAMAAMTTASTVLAVLVLLGRVSPSTLLVLLFLSGLGGVLYAPAWLATVPDLVPRQMVPAAVALNSISYNIARTAAPALGGVVVLAAGPATAFALNALSYLLLVLAVLRWKPPPRQPDVSRMSLWGAVITGVRHVASDQVLRVTLLRAGVFGLGTAALWALLPLVSRDLLRGDALLYGVLLGAMGFGAVAAGLGNPTLRRRFASRHLAVLATTLFALGSAVTGLSSTPWLTVPALVLAGAGWVMGLTNYNITVQTFAPRWVAARAMALYLMATLGSAAMGAVLWGACAAAWGIGPALWGASVVLSLLFWLMHRLVPYPPEAPISAES